MNCLLKKVYQIGHMDLLRYLQGCVDEAENRMCRICWESQKRKTISCKGGNTSNLFSHSLITSNIMINLKVQYIVE